MNHCIITLGDPLSVNTELVYKLMTQEKKLFTNCAITLVGSQYHWENQIHALSLSSEHKTQFLDIGGVEKDTRQLSTKERGQIAVQALHAAAKYIQSHSDKEKIAVLTCPIDKFAVHEAGFKYPGHTEFFTDISRCKTLMLLAGPKLKVGLASNHLSLRDVSKNLTQERIEEKLQILYTFLQNSFSINNPRIAVCGLNPHCSDGGLFGDEEERVIKPAIAKFNKTSVTGPHPADTVFYRALQGKFDAVLAMYHDQGLGPLKTVHFDDAVNITCGLPYLRLSPDHGPAKDLYLQNKASLNSIRAAMHVVQSYFSGGKIL